MKPGKKLSPVRPPERPSWAARHAALLCVLAAMVFLVAVRLRVADIPLERDEGEYAYSGQLILEGIPPFQLAYNMKFPGTYYAYSVILAIFGQTAWGVHAGLIVVNAATILILFFLARRLLEDPMAAAVAAIAYGFLSVDRWSLAIFGHATHFVVAAALAGLLILFHAIDSKRAVLFAAAGVLLGLSVLMKQNGIFFLAFGLGVAAWSGASVIRPAVVAVGAAVPILIMFGVFYAQGVLEKFWFWTIQYAREYTSVVSGADAWTNLKGNFANITMANAPIWVIALLGVLLLGVAPWKWRVRVQLAAFLLVSAAAVLPGLYFRQHYFILMFPALALFCGVAALSLQRLLSRVTSAPVARAAGIGVFLIAVVIYGAREWDYFFSIPTRQLSRMIYGANPFVESPEVARYIQSHTEDGDRIAVLGSEPQIYFYANRKSATGYIYTYPLLENQKYAARMQDEMIAEITSAYPKYLVYVAVNESWLARDRTQKIMKWSEAYIRQCYRVVGIGDVLSETETGWAWDDAVLRYRPKSRAVIYTLSRRSEEPCSVELPK